MHSKFVGHSTEIIEQSKIKVPLAHTHIMYYTERFIRNDFSTSQISQEFKEQTSLFIEK